MMRTLVSASSLNKLPRLGRLPPAQNRTFRLNWSVRDEFAVPKIWPKVAGLLRLVAGVPRIAVFGRLNASARNSTERDSMNGNWRNTEASMFHNAADLSRNRPRLPKV